jgi:hypothetical protein
MFVSRAGLTFIRLVTIETEALRERALESPQPR